MKTIKQAIIIAATSSLMIFFNNKSFSQNIDNTLIESPICLEISGKVTFENNPLNKDFKIELICENSTEKVINSKKSHFKFDLLRNHYYTLKITKAGYLTKYISICTKLDEFETDGPLFRFSFETELLSEESGKNLNPDALEFPIALISFDPQEDGFNNNELFTANMKSLIYPKYRFKNRK